MPPKIKPKQAKIKQTKIKQHIEHPVEYYSWVEGGQYKNNTEYILPNITKFPDFVFTKYDNYRLGKAHIKNCEDIDKKEESDLFLYQKFVLKYLEKSSPYRGILLYYGLGSGKTRAAIEIAKQYREIGKKVVFISPASLVDNFIGELIKWGDLNLGKNKNKNSVPDKEDLKPHGYLFVSYNAPNKLTQLNKVATNGVIKNKVIIVDEVHNMSQFLHNGMNTLNKNIRERSTKFYEMLLNSYNCRFIFLSGTPIINTPSELSVTFNLLRGPMQFRNKPKNITIDKQRLPNKVRLDDETHEVFPTTSDEFNDIFIDWDNLQIKNRKIFKQRIMGLVSYYAGAKGDLYPVMSTKDIDYPIAKSSIILVNVPMSDLQLDEYLYWRMKEMDEARKQRKKLAMMKMKMKMKEDIRREQEEGERIEIIQEIKDQKTASNVSFRVRSRQISNFTFPPELQELRPYVITEKAKLKKLYMAFDENSEIFQEKNLAQYSPKMLEMLRVINKDKKDKKKDGNILVYSNFRSIEGIEIFAKILEENGYVWYDPKKIKLDPENNYKRFAILGKDRRTDEDNTTEILKVFNNKENKKGKDIKILLGTSSIAEGISLFNIRKVLIMEPHWNMVRINQLIGRARRICSHKELPKDEWNFETYMFFSVIPPGTMNITPHENNNPTDIILYKMSETKEKIKNEFIHMIKESAVDCVLNMLHNENLKQKPPVKCLSFPKSEELIYTYYPNIKDDLTYIGRYAEEVVEEQINTKVFNEKALPKKYHKKFQDANNKSKYRIRVDKKGNPMVFKIRLRESDKIMPAFELYDKKYTDETGQHKLSGYLIQPPSLVKEEDVIKVMK